MTTPFPFVASQILTASELNSITNLPSSTKTANYVLTIANLGSRVVMNAAGSTTITVNTSIFSAGDIVELSNIGAGVCTVTAGTATVSSAGPLAIPQYGGGQLVFSSASAAIYFPAAVNVAAPAAPGLTLILKTNFTTGATSLAMTNVFSATYNNYLVIITKLVASGDANEARVRVGTSGTAYAGADYDYAINAVNGGTAYNAQSLNDTKFLMLGSYVGNVEPSSLVITLNNPNLAIETTLTSNNFGNRNTTLSGEQFGGALNTSTQYTDFFLGVQTPPTDTIVAEIAIYGYAIS